MNTPSAKPYAAVGAALIALSYGLARFAFGLYVPAIRADLSLSPQVTGTVGAMPFVSFSVASIFAVSVANRLGARGAALLASLLGLFGLFGISQAFGAWSLGAAVFACGLCTGLMMPALTAGMHAAVRPSLHGRVSAIMNAGTSLGVVISVPTALLLSEQWRDSYLAFAVVALICALLTWRFVPVGSGAASSRSDAVDLAGRRSKLCWLAVFSFGMGLVSSAYWVFAPDLAVSVGNLPSNRIGWLWLALGVAGLLGGAASDLADRCGVALTQGLAMASLALALGVLALWPGSFPITLLSAALFGVVYMLLTGIHLMTGVRLLPDRPAAGSVVPFLSIAVGQAIGSQATGQLVAELGHVDAFLAMAGFGLALAVGSFFFPTTRPVEPSDQPR